MDSQIVFISLIGKGRTREGVKGYLKTKYIFEETNDIISTSFFSSALYKILTNQGFCIDKWLIFGTDKSSWSELIYIIDEKYHNELIGIYDMVYDEENDKISQKTLSKWEKVLQKHVPSIRLIIVDPLDYEIYIDYMLKETPNERRRLVLDITHAFRHMPVIMAFSLMVLKHLKDISNITAYYGAFELKKDRGSDDEPAPVLKIDFINNLVSYAESLAILNNSGYFPNILGDLGINDTDETYFWLEMNRQPREYLKLINEGLGSISNSSNNHRSIIANYLKNEMEPLIAASLEERMIKRAIFFFERKQYLKSLILLYEGLIITIGKKHGLGTGQNYEDNRKTRDYINNNQFQIFVDKDQKTTYYDLEYTRNSAVHGSRSRGTQNYVERQDHFEGLFQKGLKLYKNIYSKEKVR